LEALNTGLTDIAFSHLLDPETGDYNTPYLKQYCPDNNPVVVNMFYRQVGFLVVNQGPKFPGLGKSDQQEDSFY